MPYEYRFSPGDQGRFPPELLEAMHAYVRQLPHVMAEDGTYVLFRSADERDLRAPRLARQPGRNSYLEPFIAISETAVLLSTVADVRVDRHVYEFVLWCGRQWPGQLFYGADPVSPEALIAEA